MIQGGSSGAHLSLLYSYMIKNPPIPIKIIINNVGPVTLNPDYFWQTEPGKEPLDNITNLLLISFILKAFIKSTSSSVPSMFLIDILFISTPSYHTQ